MEGEPVHNTRDFVFRLSEPFLRGIRKVYRLPIEVLPDHEFSTKYQDNIRRIDAALTKGEFGVHVFHKPQKLSNLINFLIEYQAKLHEVDESLAVAGAEAGTTFDIVAPDSSLFLTPAEEEALYDYQDSVQDYEIRYGKLD